MHLIQSLGRAGCSVPCYLSHFKSMPVAGLKSMSVLHLRDSSVDSPLRAWIPRKRERKAEKGR